MSGFTAELQQLTDPVVVLMRRVVADCGVLCRQDEFRCSSGRCVLFLHRCDGHDDCGDYSDERGCVCAIGELQCPGDQCVSAERVCDGHRDCPSGIDELICPVKGIHAKQDSLCVSEIKCTMNTY